MEKVVRTTCQGCHCECGVLVYVENEKIKKIEGDPNFPMNKGFVCVKGKQYHEFVYHPERLKYPLKRKGERGEGKWERVTWNQALTEIAEKLTEIKEKYGSEAIAAIQGTAPRSSRISMHVLVYALGSPNIASTDWHVCAAPTGLACVCTVGESILMEVGPDYENAKCIVVWGGNPLNSHPPKGVEILRAKRQRNAKLIVIDPRKTQLASEADLWLQIRPGTDCALALGMINTIIEEGLYDEEFVKKWCYGFDSLRERTKSFTPEKVADITWVPAEKIREAARIYAITKPAALHQRVAVEQNINSVQTCRALIIMVALTGNIDVPGGNILPPKREGFVSTNALCGRGKEWKSFRPPPEIENKRIGGEQYPLVSSSETIHTTFVVAPLLFDAILTSDPYPIKALFCAGANPVVSVQNSKKVWKALLNLDLFVVADFFMTPTAELADYVLPVTMWPERDEICDMMYTNYIAARQKAIEPVGECWDDMKIVIELIKKIPWADRKFIPWNSVEEFNNWRLKGLGITFDDLKKKGFIVWPLSYRKYESHGFNTPTGKVELYSTVLEKFGYDPLPHYLEPAESPLSTPELLNEYPFILISGARYINFFHSEGRQIPSLRKMVPDPEIEINPQTASNLGIKNGDWVWVETPQVKGERVRFKAKITNAIHPRVINVSHGWWFPEKPPPEHGCFESNVNIILRDSPPRDKIIGSLPLRGTLCKIYRCESNKI